MVIWFSMRLIICSWVAICLDIQTYAATSPAKIAVARSNREAAAVVRSHLFHINFIRGTGTSKDVRTNIAVSQPGFTHNRTPTITISVMTQPIVSDPLTLPAIALQE